MSAKGILGCEVHGGFFDVSDVDVLRSCDVSPTGRWCTSYVRNYGRHPERETGRRANLIEMGFSAALKQDSGTATRVPYM